MNRIPNDMIMSDEAIKLGLDLNNIFYNLLTIEKVLADNSHLQELIDARSKTDPEEIENDTFYMDRSVMTEFSRRKGKSPVTEIVNLYSVWSNKSLDVCVNNIENLWNVPVYNHLVEHVTILKQIRGVLASVKMPYQQFEEAQRSHLYEDIRNIKGMLEE